PVHGHVRVARHKPAEIAAPCACHPDREPIELAFRLDVYGSLGPDVEFASGETAYGNIVAALDTQGRQRRCGDFHLRLAAVRAQPIPCFRFDVQRLATDLRPDTVEHIRRRRHLDALSAADSDV